MPCYIRMKRSFLQGLLWLYLYGFGFMALSLEPGFLDFDNLPDTNFSCVGKVIGGYYADLETNCQMFHVCTIGQLDEPMDIRFLCLNGTVFDQETRVCERIDEVDCTKSEQFYSLNLELYGHSQSSNIEENETEQPLIIKSTLPTTTTTTHPPRKTTRAPFYSSASPPTATTLFNRIPSVNNNIPSENNNHHIASHHFPVINPIVTDIRFNPEEINISLHPGAPPDIRTKSVSYYSDKKVTNFDNKLVVTTHRVAFDDPRREILNTGSSTQKIKYNTGVPGEGEYGFTFSQEDSGEYTEPPESYRIRTEFRPSQEYAAALHNPKAQQYKSSTFRNDYASSTPKINNYQQQKPSTTINYFVHSLKPPAPNQQNHYEVLHTEKTSQKVQLPVLPTLPALTFSSPAPFSLQNRKEQKRYTKDHIPPPRIVVSASASVSDASGRRLNYSLGTIEAAQLFKTPPRTYDEYKDEDVALDPFYLDVPKLSARRKRSLDEDKSASKRKINYSDIIKTDEEALHVLKFLFDWYKNEKTNPARYTTPLSTPLDTEGISSINYGLAPETESSSYEEKDDNDGFDVVYNTKDSFGKKTKYSLIDGDVSRVSHEEERKINNVHEKFTIEHNPDNDEIFHTEEDYVNDNYEPLTYKEQEFKENYSSHLKHKDRYANVDENKKYSTSDEYVDDNIEPLYYKERNYDRSVERSEFTSEAPINDFEDTSDKEEEYNFSSHKDTTIFTPTEHPEKQKSTNEPTLDESTSTPRFDFENTLTTDTSYLSTTKSMSNRKSTTQKDRRFGETINKEDKENASLEKLIEKPYRAKDDYDYLRTVHYQTSTFNPYFENTETDFIPTITEAPTTLEPVTQKTIVKVITTVEENENVTDNTEYTITTSSTTTTEKPKRKNKTRRGKHKFGENVHEESAFTRKKARYTPKSTEVNYGSYVSAQSKDKIIKSLDYANLSENVTRDNAKIDREEPYSEILESTTKITKRGRSRFANVVKENKTKNLENAYPNDIDFSLSEYQNKIKTEVTKIADINSKKFTYEDVHATLFVPSTESIHITKKKQLKENLLTTGYDTTTRTYRDTTTVSSSPTTVSSSPTTVFGSPTTVHSYITTWQTEDLRRMIEGIETNTKSVVAFEIYKQLTNEDKTKVDYNVTTTLIQITTEATIMEESTLPIEISGVNFVSMSVEGEEKVDLMKESTTKEPSVTTEIIELNKNNLVLEIEKKLKKSFNDKKEHLTDENKPKLEEITTETVTLSENIDTTSNLPQTSTTTFESTTYLDKYSQIPTTFEQTTIESSTPDPFTTESTQTVTTELTTTLKPRRGGKPTIKRLSNYQRSGYRHRFSTNQFTRRPKSRKQNIKDDIVAAVRKTSVETTTESFKNPEENDYVLTDYPLRKSVVPTQAERTIVTTPFYQSTSTHKHFFFNCFGKEVDKFYPDLRDCRLFHYCTQGYGKNQLLDLKFVCDLKTYFDDEKLICTKTKPKRCS